MQVRRTTRSVAHIGEGVDECIVVDTRMADAVESDPIEGTVVGEMGSSEKLSLQDGKGHIGGVEDADHLATKRALNGCEVVQGSILHNPTPGNTQMASTNTIDSVACYDELSQRPDERLRSSWNGTAPHSTELQPLLRPRQVHPPAQDSTRSQQDVAHLRAALNSDIVPAPQHQYLPPLLPPFSTTPSSELMIPQQPCKSNAVTFTVENEIRSALSPTEIDLLFQFFSRNARLLLRSKGCPTEGILYPVEALMRQTSTDFYKWYAVESKAAAKVSVLRFKLLDCNWYDGGTILVPGGNLRYFQLLKQNIWDCFWLMSSLNCTPFHIFVSHLPGNNLECGAIESAFEMTTSFTANSSMLTALPYSEVLVRPGVEGFTAGNAPGVSSSFQDLQPPQIRRESNIHQLLNPLNVDI